MHLRPIFLTALAFIVGIAVSAYFALSAWICILICVCSLLLLLFLKIPHRGICLVLLTALLTATSVTYLHILVRATRPTYENVTLTAHLTDRKNVYDDTIRYVVRDIYVIQSDTLFALPGTAYLYLPNDYEAGTALQITGDIQPLELLDSNGHCNLRNATNSVDYRITAHSVRFSDATPNLGERLRQRIAEIVQPLGENAEIAYALITGDKNDLASDIQDNFADCGISHVLAISGLHVGFLSVMLHKLFRKLRFKPKTTFIWLGLLLFGYAAFCGFTPSVVRAAVMALVVEGAIVVKRPYDILNSLSLSALVILLFNPFSLFHIGFILSFTSVLGIGCTYRLCIDCFARDNFLTSSLSMTTSAQLFSLPFALYYFGNLSIVSLLANLIAVPLISVIFSLLMVLTVLILLLPPLAICIQVLQPFFQFLLNFAQLLSAQPFASVQFHLPIYFALFNAVILFLVSPFTFFTKRTKIALLVSLVICFFLCLL